MVSTAIPMNVPVIGQDEFKFDATCGNESYFRRK
jgi:hypothetical protein